MAETSPLIISVSGIRGIMGSSLTPDVVLRFASAYGSPLAGGRVIVSRDGRAGGDILARAAIAGLQAVGCDALDAGICATPSCGFLVRTSSAAGGIQITASHNPPEWNGLKLFRSEGFVLSPDAGAKVAEDFRSGRWNFQPYDSVGIYETLCNPSRRHLDAVIGAVDSRAIRARRLKVAFDANHGSGGVFGPQLLSDLGCEFTIFGESPDGRFEHAPEPTAENLKGFSGLIGAMGFDVGFAVDPDADRLALVDETGRYIGEELTLALAVKHRLRSVQGPVVINGSTSRVTEDVARSAGCPVFRTPVGEVHVAERMLAAQAVIGGEGNGGVIDPRIGMGRDSAIGIALILELMAQTNEKLSQLADDLPRYAIHKEKFPVDRKNLEAVLDRVASAFSDGRPDRSDGVRVEWEDRWVQLRASNTEPIIRVIAEAPNQRDAIALCEKVKNFL